MFDWIVGWAAQRLTFKPDSSRFLLNLAVNSQDKNKAVVKLLYLDGGFVASITTQNSFKGIYRGLYRYTVEHFPDYKPFDSAAANPAQHLNLVDWDWSEKGLSCTLVPRSSHDDALPCNLQ
jgi:hypothetical protein